MIDPVHIMQIYGGAEVELGGEWSVSRPSRFIPGTNPVTHWRRGRPHSRSGRFGEQRNLDVFLVLALESVICVY
jgi:hypothetical protein